MRAGLEILDALDKASKGVQAAATELSDLSQKFHEARIDDNGEIVNGIGLEYKVAVDEEVVAIFELALAEDRKPPAQDVRAAMAERAVRVKRPDLWAEYHATSARIEALKSWIINQKAGHQRQPVDQAR
jgi:hypothetical protein